MNFVFLSQEQYHYEILFSPVEDKSDISTPPCDALPSTVYWRICLLILSETEAPSTGVDITHVEDSMKKDALIEGKCVSYFQNNGCINWKLMWVCYSLRSPRSRFQWNACLDAILDFGRGETDKEWKSDDEEWSGRDFANIFRCKISPCSLPLRRDSTKTASYAGKVC